MAAADPAPARRPPRLAAVVDATRMSRFLLLLQQGVGIRRRVGCSVAVFLRGELGVRQEAIGRIQSIILDGKPVDDIDTALVRDGSTLALSAAMPGLVGATLRRGGAYSSLRSSITHHETQMTCARAEGRVTLKLFNLLMAELGPGLLQEGVLVRVRDLLDLLAALPADTLQDDGRITLDGKATTSELLLAGAGLSPAEPVLLSVSCAPPR